jgi:hypothetical protein
MQRTVFVLSPSPSTNDASRTSHIADLHAFGAMQDAHCLSFIRKTTHQIDAPPLRLPSIQTRLVHQFLSLEQQFICQLGLKI